MSLFVVFNLIFSYNGAQKTFALIQKWKVSIISLNCKKNDKTPKISSSTFWTTWSYRTMVTLWLSAGNNNYSINQHYRRIASVNPRSHFLVSYSCTSWSCLLFTSANAFYFPDSFVLCCCYIGFLSCATNNFPLSVNLYLQGFYFSCFFLHNCSMTAESFSPLHLWGLLNLDANFAIKFSFIFLVKNASVRSAV